MKQTSTIADDTKPSILPRESYYLNQIVHMCFKCCAIIRPDYGVDGPIRF